MEETGSICTSCWSRRRRDACTMSRVPANFMILRCYETLSNFILKTTTTQF